MKPLRIGKIALQAGVGVETIRFYEREGLIDKPFRRESGYRQYSEEAVNRVRFIRRAKDLGFSLKEIRELLDLRIEPNATSAEVHSRASGKIEEISDKIQSLQRMKEALENLVAACGGKGPISECPILEAMDGKNMNLNKEVSKMTKDLVCGMEIEEGTNCAEYEGKRYCFCAETCREEFLKDPSKYLEADKE